MTILYKSVRNLNIVNSATLLYTVPANTEAYLLGVIMCNPTTTSSNPSNTEGTISMKLGGFHLFSQLRVAHNSTYEALNGQKIMLTAGEQIVIEGTNIPQSSAGTLHLHVSLMEVS